MKISSALASTYYEEWIQAYSEIFVISRKQEYRKNPNKLLSIQLTLAKLESKLWEPLREGKQRTKKLLSKKVLTVKEKKELEGLQLHVQIHRMLLNISRTICDGVVWRNLDYDRMLLESSSRGFGTGAADINKLDMQSEFTWAKRIVDHFGSIVVVNDLTRYLRIGDLTEISNRTMFVHEIKKLGKVVKNIFTLRKDIKTGKAKLSKQAKRLLELQRTAITREISTPSGKITSRLINIKIKSHWHKIALLMKASETDFFLSEQIEPFLKVEITNFRTIRSISKEDLQKHLKSKPETVGKDHIKLVHSNWDSFYFDEQGNFFRSVPPYSVFPMKNKICMDLMSGHIKVQSEIDLTELKNILGQHNWEAELISEAEQNKYTKDVEKIKGVIFTGKIYEHALDIPLLTIRRGPFSTEINSSLIVRMTMEFMTFDTLLEILEESYQRAAKTKAHAIFYPVFKEKDLWN